MFLWGCIDTVTPLEALLVDSRSHPLKENDDLCLVGDSGLQTSWRVPVGLVSPTAIPPWEGCFWRPVRLSLWLAALERLALEW